jgi:hypothetical protein
VTDQPSQPVHGALRIKLIHWLSNTLLSSQTSNAHHKPASQPARGATLSTLPVTGLSGKSASGASRPHTRL